MHRFSDMITMPLFLKPCFPCLIIHHIDLGNKFKHLHKGNTYITFDKSCIIHTSPFGFTNYDLAEEIYKKS